MSVYAVVRDGIVTNTVVAQDEDETALALLLSDADEIIKVSGSTGPAHVGGDIVGGRFRRAKPFPSWGWDDERWDWVAPAPYPNEDLGYFWDEDSLSWVEAT